MPGDFEFWFARALDAYKRESHIRARRCFRLALECDDQRAIAWRLYSQSLLELGEYEEAVGAAERAVDLAPREVVMWEGLGRACEAAERWQEAERAFCEAAELAPAIARPHIFLGVLHARRGRHAEAEACYRRALEIEPDNEEAMHNLACRVAERDPEEARALLARAVEIDPEYVSAWDNLGYSCWVQGDLGAAERHLRRALRLDPQHVGAYFCLGCVCKQAKQFGKAADAFRRACEIEPQDPQSWRHLGEALRKGGQLEEAEGCLRKAWRLDATNADTAFELACCLEGRDEPQNRRKAERWLRKALALEPEHARAHCELAYLLAERGKFEDAETHYRRGCELEPANPFMRGMYADFCEERGRMAEAAEMYAAAVAANPDYEFGHFRLAQCLCALGRFEAARAPLQTYLRLAPKGQYVDTARALLGGIGTGTQG